MEIKNIFIGRLIGSGIWRTLIIAFLILFEIIGIAALVFAIGKMTWTYIERELTYIMN